MNIKQKVRIKLQQILIDIFLNQTLCELADCLFWFIKIKVTVLKDLKLEDITLQKVLSTIITSLSMEKTFMTNKLILI